MWKFTFITAVFIYFFTLKYSYTQNVYTYDFGTTTASYTVAGSSNNITAAPSGNAYIYVASSPNGGAQIKNPGISTFGSGSKLMLHSSSSGGSSNKFAIWGYSGGTSSYTKFTVVLADSNGSNTPTSGIFYFCTGTGTSFQNNNGLSPGEILSGIKWSVSNTGNITTKAIRVGNSWRDITINPFYQGQTNAYTIEVFGNNGFSAVNYNYNSTSNSVAPLKQDIYVNGVLCADDFDVSGNGLVQGSSVDCLMFYVEENSASKLCAFIDNVSYQSTISPNVQTYVDYYSKSSGNLNLTNNWTTNSDGSGTEYPPNFSGGTGGISFMNFYLTNRAAATIDANWNISGANCKLYIGNGVQACTLNVPASYTFSTPFVMINNAGVLQISNSSSSITSMNVQSGGIYIHNCNGSQIPPSVWNINSSCIVSGVTNSAPSGFEQSFYNLTWNCSSQSQDINLVLPSGFSVVNNMTVQNTGSVTGRTLQLIQNTSRTVSIGGNLSLTGGHFSLSSGSGSMGLSVLGNTTVSNYSELYLSEGGSANSTLTLYGNISVESGCTITDNGSQTGNTIIFAKNGTQNLYRSGSINNVNYSVNSGTTLVIDNDIPVSSSRSMTLNGTIYFWNYLLSGAGNFILNNGATIGIGNTGGLTSSGLLGNIQNTGTRIYSTSANYIYNGSIAQETGNGLPSQVNNLTFENTAGFVLTSPVNVNGMLSLRSGIIDIANNNITVNSGGSISGPMGDFTSASYFKTTGTGTLKLFAGPAEITFPVGNGSYTPVTIRNSGTNDYICIRVQNSIDNPVVNDHIVNKQWVISEDTPGGNNITAAFTWNPVDESINFDRMSNIYIGNWTGIAWETYYAGYGYNGPGPYTVIASEQNLLGNYVIGNPGALPVELVYFNTLVKQNDIILKWKTASEINNTGFEIYRKKTGQGDWVKTGFIAGRGTSNTETEYLFTDSKLETGQYNYRLKQIDVNGNYEFFNLNSPVSIDKPQKYELLQNYPNPFNPVTKIDYYISQKSFVEIIIYDMLGKEVASPVKEIKEAGYYTADFNGSFLASGIYFYRLKACNFTEIKKMILMK